jgi:hypothetical protein
VSLRTEYGTTLCDSFGTRITAKPFRTGFEGSHTLLAHFVRPSSLKGGPSEHGDVVPQEARRLVELYCGGVTTEGCVWNWSTIQHRMAWR